MGGDNYAIRLSRVHKRFAGTATPAVTDLTLDIPEGKLVAFVGPSGCGKTTTLKMINRLVEPTSGTIEVLGTDIQSIKAPQLRRKIGYVIQQIGLFPHRTIAHNIATVPRLLKWDKARIAARVEELTELVRLDPEVLRRYPAELSGGQQQRVGVARALAADPPIILMDEPYSAVDPVVRARLQDELIELHQRVGKTIVVVTHDIDEAIKLGEEVVIFEMGGIIAQRGTPHDVLGEPASPFVEGFLGAERGLKRLALMTIADLDLDPKRGIVIDANAHPDEALTVMRDHAVNWIAITDGDRLLGWVWDTDLDGSSLGGSSVGGSSVGGIARVGDANFEPFRTTVGPDTSLRTTLDEIVNSRTQVAVVVDEGRYLGMVTIDHLSEGIQ